jgi:hypothetical protein
MPFAVEAVVAAFGDAVREGDDGCALPAVG